MYTMHIQYVSKSSVLKVNVTDHKLIRMHACMYVCMYPGHSRHNSDLSDPLSSSQAKGKQSMKNLGAISNPNTVTATSSAWSCSARLRWMGFSMVMKILFLARPASRTCCCTCRLEMQISSGP